jgi:hypothetical protein
MTKVFQRTVATTDPISGRKFRIPEQVLYQMADQIRSGTLPLSIDHDPRKRIIPHILQVEVCPTDRETLALQVVYELSDEDARACEGKLGFSASVTELFQIPNPNDAYNKPHLILMVDSSHFDDDTYNAAIQELTRYFFVEARYIHQFSLLPPPQVIVDIASNAAGGVISTAIISALTTACKKFLKSKDKQPTLFTFKNRDMTVYLETTEADSEALQETIKRSFEAKSVSVKSISEKKSPQPS